MIYSSSLGDSSPKAAVRTCQCESTQRGGHKNCQDLQDKCTFRTLWDFLSHSLIFDCFWLIFRDHLRLWDHLQLSAIALTLCDHFRLCDYFRLSGIISDSLGLFPTLWDYFQLSAIISDSLRLFPTLCDYFRLSGIISDSLRSFQTAIISDSSSVIVFDSAIISDSLRLRL